MSLSLKVLCKQFYEFIRFQFYRAEMMIFFIGKEACLEKRMRMEAKGNRKKGGRCRNEEKRNEGEASKR